MSDRETDGRSKTDGKEEKSWVDFRRKVSDVHENMRAHPRLEFHCQARIGGVKGVFRVTDISMGGAFLEYTPPSAFKLGQTLQLTMKLPTEYDPIKIKAEVVNVRERGVGLRFVNMTRRNQEIIRFCFETFKDTVPLK
jgi:hypothetical protein